MGRTSLAIDLFRCSFTLLKAKHVLDFTFLFPKYFFIIFTIDLWSAGCALIESNFKTISEVQNWNKYMCVFEALNSDKLFMIHEVILTYFGTLRLRKAISQLAVQAYLSVRTFST